MRCFALAGAVVLALAAGVRAEDKPEPAYRQDGKDLVISLKVRANNSPHALVAWADGDDRGLTLRYILVQNKDALVRSQKWVTAEWRLAGKRAADVTVKGVEAVAATLKAGELQPFAEQLQKVAEAGGKKGG